MPVTIRPQPTQVSSIDTTAARTTASDILAGKENGRKILRHSFEDRGGGKIIPETNGFVHTVLHAFQKDMHLELRPDDVWQAIMSQFGFYVNANAEELRHVFVNHGGQKQLELDITPLNIRTADVGVVAQGLASLVKENLADPELADWVMPKFSTTLDSDRAIAAMMLLGAMKKYFGYFFITGCGFPSVTLHGGRDDWVDLVTRAKRLSSDFGAEAAAWCVPLVKVLGMMLAGFDGPDTGEIRDFWMSACHLEKAQGSGSKINLSGTEVEKLSGWLTVFCWWDENGRRVKDIERLQGYTIGGARCPVIEETDIPSGTTKVPVVWINLFSGEVHETEILAGLVGMKLLDDQGSRAQPASGWWVLEERRRFLQ
ncbi:hypothetical protein OQA88_13685 [Cercophora sp. LCS_1]